MQKKVVGIITGVAAAHAVLLVGLITGGGCHRTTVLGPHTYNNGPEFNEIPPASTAPAVPQQLPPAVGGAGEVPPAVDVTPTPVVTPPPVTPVVTPPPAPQPVASAATYTVKKGDNLSVIAYKHGVSVKALAACNNLSGKDMNRLRIGQVLNIPEGGSYNPDRQPPKRKKSSVKNNSGSTSSAAASAERPADGIYVVKSGDSLERIGRRFGVSARAIAKENNISLDKVLHIGDKLRIPAKGSNSSSAPAPVADKKTPAPSTAEPNVQTLDSLDDLDPEIGNTPAASTDSAASDAAAPAADNSARAITDSWEIPNDTTVEDFCKQIGIEPSDLRRYNPELPADGKLKGGSYVIVPQMQL